MKGHRCHPSAAERTPLPPRFARLSAMILDLATSTLFLRLRGRVVARTT